MNNILVTGGAGFIGSHIVDALASKGHNVIVLDNLSTGQASNTNNGLLIQRSISDPLNDIFDQYQFDYVFHLAAQINLRHSIKEPQQDAQTNILGSLNVLENCIRTNVKRVIFSSTGGAMYSSKAAFRLSSRLPFSETSKADPESPYGLAKLTIEKYLHMFNKLYGLKSTVLRYSNVFGPRQNSKGEAGVISIFIEKALKNEDIIIFGNGTQTRDFIYVDDVVKANMLALDVELDDVFNVSSNTQYSVSEISDKILQYTNSSSKIIHAAPIKGEMLHTRLNADKLKVRGWSPTWNIDDGIQATIDYFK